MSNWVEWAVQLRCRDCGRSSCTFVKATRNEKKAIGCKKCHLNTDVEIRERKVKVGALEITVYIPYYC